MFVDMMTVYLDVDIFMLILEALAWKRIPYEYKAINLLKEEQVG
jgi:hypothetical protein